MNDVILNNYNGYLCKINNHICALKKIKLLYDNKILLDRFSKNAHLSITHEYSDIIISKIIYDFVYE